MSERLELKHDEDDYQSCTYCGQYQDAISLKDNCPVRERDHWHATTLQLGNAYGHLLLCVRRAISLMDPYEKHRLMSAVETSVYHQLEQIIEWADANPIQKYYDLVVKMDKMKARLEAVERMRTIRTDGILKRAEQKGK